MTYLVIVLVAFGAGWLACSIHLYLETRPETAPEKLSFEGRLAAETRGVIEDWGLDPLTIERGVAEGHQPSVETHEDAKSIAVTYLDSSAAMRVS